jgi:hypothetical protein
MAAGDSVSCGDADDGREEKEGDLRRGHGEDQQALLLSEDEHEAEHDGGGVLADDGEGDEGMHSLHVMSDGEGVAGEARAGDEGHDDAEGGGLLAEVVIEGDGGHRANDDEDEADDESARTDDAAFWNK